MQYYLGKLSGLYHETTFLGVEIKLSGFMHSCLKHVTFSICPVCELACTVGPDKNMLYTCGWSMRRGREGRRGGDVNVGFGGISKFQIAYFNKSKQMLLLENNSSDGSYSLALWVSRVCLTC